MQGRDERVDIAAGILKDKILRDEAPEINGVAVDVVTGKLIVFYIDQDRAWALLEEVAKSLPAKSPDFLESVELYSGKRSTADRKKRGVIFLPFFAKLLRLFKMIFPLKPSRFILPDQGVAGYQGVEGRLGCFVSHVTSVKGGLTVGHLFFSRDAGREVDFLLAAPEIYKRAGDSWLFGPLDASIGNLADCALFKLDLTSVKPESDNRISGNFIGEEAIAGTEQRWVKNLANNSHGQVRSIHGVIVYEVAIRGQALQKFKFVDQIMVDGAGFGQGGDSGALVVMAESESDGGSAIGVYTYPPQQGPYHFLSPFYACAKQLEISNIDN